MKPFDLFTLLQGHKGEKFFSVAHGEVTIDHLSPHNNRSSQPLIAILAPDGNVRNLHAQGGLLPNMPTILYPSRESFAKYPLNPEKAWEEWEEAQKSKRWRAEEGGKYWWVDICGQVSTFTETNSNTDDGMYNFGNYFRTADDAIRAASFVEEYFHEFHEQNQQQ